MEIDFELPLKEFPRAADVTLRNAFAVDMEGDGEVGSVVLRSERDLLPSEKIDGVMANWLLTLDPYADVVRRSNATIRLGIFYDPSESVVFPLGLSAQTIQALARLNLGIDVTGYPCMEEEG